MKAIVRIDLKGIFRAKNYCSSCTFQSIINLNSKKRFIQHMFDA